MPFINAMNPERYYDQFSRGYWFGFPFLFRTDPCRKYWRRNIRRAIGLAILSKSIT